MAPSNCAPVADWVVRVDPDAPGAPLSRALLGHYDLSGALFAYDAVPGLVTTAAEAGFVGSDWRIGLGRWEAATRMLPTLSDGSPCPLPTPLAAAPPGATDLGLIASRDWFVDHGAPATLADTADDARYDLAYARSAIDVAAAFGAAPFLSIDAMPRALAANRVPLRGVCDWTFTNRVSNVRPADADVFAAAVTGAVARLVEGDAVEPGRALTHVEIWNEPELPFFWDPAFEDGAGALDRFFAAAVPTLVRLDLWRQTSAHPSAAGVRLGLASFASATTAVGMLEGFDAVSLPGGGAIPVDFVSFHAYDDDPLAVVSAVEQVAAAAAGTTRYGGVELVLAEWGPNLGTRVGDAAYAASMAPALHIATVLSLGAAAGLDRAHHAILWDFYPSLIQLGMVAYDGTPKPAHHAYALLARVITGDSRILYPAEAPDGRLGADGSVLASVAADGGVRALVVNRGSTPRRVALGFGTQGAALSELWILDDPATGPVAQPAPAAPFDVPAGAIALAVFAPAP